MLSELCCVTRKFPEVLVLFYIFLNQHFNQLFPCLLFCGTFSCRSSDGFRYFCSNFTDNSKILKVCFQSTTTTRALNHPLTYCYFPASVRLQDSDLWRCLGAFDGQLGPAALKVAIAGVQDHGVPLLPCSHPTVAGGGRAVAATIPLADVHLERPRVAAAQQERPDFVAVIAPEQPQRNKARES